jgi:hypothetical protein
MVLVQLLKAIRLHAPTDKVVLVSNYTEALDLLGQVRIAPVLNDFGRFSLRYILLDCIYGLSRRFVLPRYDIQ